MNQNRKNHPFLRRALTAVLTLLMLVNVCFPAMQAHATEETLENYLQFDMAITNAKAAANALDPQSETYQQDAQAVSATLTDLTAKVEAIVTTEAGGTSNISDDNVVTLKAMLSDAAVIVDAKSAENAAYLAKQSQPPVTPSPSDNTSNVGGNEPEKDKTTAPADNTYNVGDEETTVSEAVKGYQDTLSALAARVEALKLMDDTTEEYAAEEAALWDELTAVEESLGAAKADGTITVDEYDTLIAQQGAVVDTMPVTVFMLKKSLFLILLTAVFKLVIKQ